MRFNSVPLIKMYTSISYITFNGAKLRYRFHDLRARLTEQEANDFNQSP